MTAKRPPSLLFIPKTAKQHVPTAVSQRASHPLQGRSVPRRPDQPAFAFSGMRGMLWTRHDMITVHNGYNIFSADDDGLGPADQLSTVMLVEKYFHTETDPTQVQVNPENGKWHRKNIPQLLHVIKSSDSVVGASHVLPTSADQMNRFLTRQINEPELFAEVTSRAAVCWEAFYVSTLVLEPDHRGKGLARRALEITVDWIIEYKNPKPAFYYWAYSADGARVIESLRQNIESRGGSLGAAQLS